MYEDIGGYKRLIVEKKKPNLKAYYTFNLQAEGFGLLTRLREQFDLDTAPGGPPEEYNRRVEDAIDYLEKLLPTFAVIDERYDNEGRSCILIEKGRFYGMGYMPGDAAVYSAEELKSYLQVYPENDYIRGLIYQYVRRKPEKKIVFN